MLFPKRPDVKVISTTAALGTSLQLALTREFWLESIILKFSFTSGTTLGAVTANSLLAILKRVRMSITDATGNRKILDCPGFALLEYWRQLLGNLDRTTNARMPSITAGIAVADSTAYTLYFPIPFRLPQLQDPFGAATMLPLPRLNVDPVLEIDIGAAADISATFNLTGNITVSAMINKRDVVTKDQFPYIPGELITYTKQWASSGKADWEIPAQGTVTGILISDLAQANTRSTVLASNSEDWSVEYLSSIIRRQNPDFIQVENDYTVTTWPATWNNPAGSFYLDFITDYAGADAFNMGSALDLNPLILNGGKARVIGSSITGGNVATTYFTVQKLFGDLRGVKFA